MLVLNLPAFAQSGEPKPSCAKLLLNKIDDVVSPLVDGAEIARRKNRTAAHFVVFELQLKQRAEPSLSADLEAVRLVAQAIADYKSLSKIIKAEDVLREAMITAVKNANALAHSQVPAQLLVRPSAVELWQQYVQIKNDCVIYRRSYCHSNVVRLYQELKNYFPTLAEHDFQVVLLKRIDDYPFKDAGADVLWDFHTFLLYDNIVLDLDIAATSVTPMQLEHYARAQYRAGEVMSKYVIPGEQYLRWSGSFLESGTFLDALSKTQPSSALVPRP